MNRPIRGRLLHDTCADCGNRLWQYDIQASSAMSVTICGRCDRPPAPGMLPRKITTDGRPIPEREVPVSPFDRPAFLILMGLAIFAMAVIECSRAG